MDFETTNSPNPTLDGLDGVAPGRAPGATARPVDGGPWRLGFLLAPGSRGDAPTADFHPLSLTLGSMAWVAGAVGRLRPRGGFTELHNRLQAFSGFHRGERLFTDAAGDLAGALEAAATLPAYAGLWAREGIGHRRGHCRGSDGSIAVRDHIPLHAGMGLALAVETLERNPAADPATLLARVFHRCRERSSPGYEGAAFEAVGLAVRTLHPTRLRVFDHVLSRGEQRLRELFWHGVGRGLYFTRGDLLPTAPRYRWPALESALAEPPNPATRQSAVSGLVWAMTLVNLRHPEIVEDRLRRHGPLAPRAFLGGIRAGLLIWRASIGVDAHLRRFLDRSLVDGLGSTDPSGLDPTTVDLLFRGVDPLTAHAPGFRKENIP